jgi:dinuclear metal center YbgI/SA1388 family protein
MILKEIVQFIENKFPLETQESYDNCGLTYGHLENKLNGILVFLDVTEEVVNEAIKKQSNLIISHHPVIFRGVTKIDGSKMNLRVLEKCIQHNIALYALHTNLDNHLSGVNKKISNRIGIENPKILQPKNNTLVKLSVYIPFDNIEQVEDALFKQGAGSIGDYTDCSFKAKGVGTFRPSKNANPTIGEKENKESVDEFKAEYLVRTRDLNNVLNAMWDSHPYEEVAHEIVPIMNVDSEIGSGMVGFLEEEMEEIEFLNKIKKAFNIKCIKHTALRGNKIKKIAVCGGSGSFLLDEAIRKDADVFITSDFKYHEYFDAENKIIILDIGHWESEQFTTELIGEILMEKFSNFAIHLTEVNTNPVNYF